MAGQDTKEARPDAEAGDKQTERLGDVVISENARAVVEDAEKAFQDALNRYDGDTANADEAELLQESPFKKPAETDDSGDASGNGPDESADAAEQREQSPAFRYGQVHEPAKFVQKPDTREQAPKVRYVESRAPVSEALRENLSQDALHHDPDLYSTWDVAPQPDGGRGMQAVGRQFWEREHARQSEGAAESEAATDEAEAAPQPKTVVWAWSNHGLDVRDFKAALDEADAGLDESERASGVVARTRAVIACDSEAKKAALESEKESLFGDWEVDIELVDPMRPETFQIPENTGIALFPDVLDKVPARQILYGQNTGSVKQVQETTAVAENNPLLRVDPVTGQVFTVPPQMLGANRTAEGAVRHDYMPQLAGRLITDSTVYKTDQQLDEHEDGAEAFMARQPRALSQMKGTVFNWQEPVRDIVSQATAGLREDGILYISGPVRDAHLGGKAWLRHTQLESMQGPIVSHAVEASEVYGGVARVDGDANLWVCGNRRGDYTYLVIDRGDLSQIEDGLAEGFAVDEGVLAKTSELDNLRHSLGIVKGELKPAMAAAVREHYDELVALNPQAGRDYAFVHEVARDLNDAGAYEDALAIAQHAVDAAPHFSGGWVEVARAEYGKDNIAGAGAALNKAREINPSNPEVYQVALDWLGNQEAMKGQLLDAYQAGRVSAEQMREIAVQLGDAHAYVSTVGDYLNTAPGLTHAEVAEWLGRITEAQERDFRLHEGDTSRFKTYVSQNLQTGELEERGISSEDARRIIVAETALKNAEAISAMLRQAGATVEQINAAMDPFLQTWEETVPRDDEGLPLPRDEWADLPQSQAERWIFAGRMSESDQQTEPSAEWHERVQQQRDAESEAAEVASDKVEAYPLQPRTSVEIGRILDRAGAVTSERKGIKLELFNRHVLVTGASGTGKSVFIKNTIENFARDTNVKTIVIYMGDSEGEYDDLAARFGEGVRVQHWRPGEVDAEAVSVNIFNPAPGVRLQDHIDQIVAFWQRVYQGDDPFPQVLSNALQKVYEANGWNAITGERGELPTFAQLQEQCEEEVRLAEYQGEAKNIKGYFKTRNEKNSKGQIGRFLETVSGSVELDWERAIDREDSDVLVVDLRSGFANPEDRRNMGMAFEMKLRQAFQARGESRDDQMRTLIIMDEAQQALRNAKAGEETRARAVEAFAQGFEQDRKYGIGRIVASPTEDIHPSIEANTAAQIRFALVSGDDIQQAAGGWLVRQEEHALDLRTQMMGQAKVMERGREEPIHVQVDFDEQRARPSAEEIRAAVARQPALSTLRTANTPSGRPYTHLEIERAQIKAEDPSSAWLSMAVGGVTLSHIMAHELPTKVPDEVRAQWRAEVARDGRLARNTLSRVVEKVVRERTEAMRINPRPIRTDLLAASVLAHTVELLDGDSSTGGRASPAFGFLPARIGLAHRQLTAPIAGTAPSARQYAVPLGFRMPTPAQPAKLSAYMPARSQVVQPGRQRVAGQISTLQAYKGSPVSGTSATKDSAAKVSGKIWDTIFGRDGGDHYWTNQQHATQGVPDDLEQRAVIAASLGYLTSPFEPRQSDLEAALLLPGYLRERIAALRQEHQAAHTKA